MSDEYDDAFDNELLRRRPVAVNGTDDRQRSRVARLASRLYSASGAPMRAKMLGCLLRPLGSLGLVAVASGVFADLVWRGSGRGAGIRIDDLGRYSRDQILELVSFVEQVSPEAVQQLGNLIADSPIGLATFSASVAMLLLRAVRVRGSGVREAGDYVASRRESIDRLTMGLGAGAARCAGCPQL